MPTLRVKPGTTAVVHMPDGQLLHMHGDRAFDSSDPLVAELLEVTNTDPSHWFIVDGGGEMPTIKRRRGRVEQATANPGEVR